jgi:hypothetical protein
MPQPTLSVLDSVGATKTINTINPNGRAAAVDSNPVVLSTEDSSALALVATESTLSALNAKVPSLGAADPTSSQPITLPLDVMVTGPAAQSTAGIDLITGNASGWYDAQNFHSVSIQIIASAGIASGQVSFEQTNDTTNASAGVFWPVVIQSTTATAPLIAATTIAASTNNLYSGAVTARYVRVRISTVFAGGTVQAVACFSQLPYQNTYVQTTAVANASVNIGQVAGQTILGPATNGSTSRSLVTGVAGPTTLVDYSAQAWAAASGSGATIANTNGLGASTAFDINVTVWTVGTSTGLVVVLQESYDNGTTYNDIWFTQPITATGHTSIPPIPIGGRRRMRWFHISGSATTATVTVTAMDSSIAFPKQMQFFDRTASVGSGTAASGTNSAAYDINGLNNIGVVMDTGTATAVASFKPQMSIDGIKWYDAGTATAINSTSATMTPLPLTAGIKGRFLRVTCTATGTTQLVNAIHIYGTN